MYFDRLYHGSQLSHQRGAKVTFVLFICICIFLVVGLYAVCVIFSSASAIECVRAKSIFLYSLNTVTIAYP